LGLELFELRQRGSGARPIVDVRVERADGSDVTIDECAAASRAIEARLDAERPLGERYVLEVSSPGIERPLRGADDWRRSVGKTAVVTSEALGGSAEVEIVAVEDTPDGAVAIVRRGRDTEIRVPLAGVRQARLAFHWKR
jgi:ribosome maturation factor RimP